MALVKYGGGIIQQSGSIAGNTFARNRFGNYVRARTKPINPKSSRQTTARTIIMYLAEYWRGVGMSDAKREAWETYANGVAWKNKLGETVKLTGFNMFIRANAAILHLDGTIVTDGPPDIGLPPGDPLFEIYELSASTGLCKIKFDGALDWCDEDAGWLMIDVGEPQNPTRNFFGGPWRHEGALKGDSGAPPTSPFSGFSVTEFTPVLGQKLWFRASIIREDGRMSTKFGAKEPVIVGA